MRRRLKEFNLLLERIEDGNYNPEDIPEGFDVHQIVEKQPKLERKVASMINNPVDFLSRKDYFSSKKQLNRSTERPLDTECRTVLQTEPEEQVHKYPTIEKEIPQPKSLDNSSAEYRINICSLD